MKSPNLIIFDYDGVLVDSLPANLQTVGNICSDLGYPVAPTPEYCRDVECISFERWADYIDMAERHRSEFVERVHVELKAIASTLPVFEGMPAVLKQLHDNHLLGVITANTTEAATSFLLKHGIISCFNDILGVDLPGSKADKIRVLLQKHRIDESRTYYVGDAGTDVSQGKAAGVQTIAVTWGYQGRERLLREVPDFVVDTPSDLLNLFS